MTTQVIIFACSFVVSGIAFGLLIRTAYREYQKEVEQKYASKKKS